MRLARYWWLPLLILEAACQQKPNPPLSPIVKIGKPYVIEGKTYYPEYDPTYDKIGDASWYGPGFHGKYTASGEIYDANDLTAAHPTLPMPSLVRVTNLTNGRSLIVRVNDRGPFHSSRIIDLSEKSAQRLGIVKTTQVRVQYLKPETDEYIASLQTAASKSTAMAQANDHVEERKNASIVQSTEPAAESAVAEIVESTTSVSHEGEAINTSAPILTVSSGDLAAPSSVSAPQPGLTPAHLPVKQAWTTANATASETPISVDNVSEPTPKTITIDRGDHFLHIESQPGDAMVIHTERIKATEATPSAASTSAHVTPSMAAGNFYVQAGSFSDEQNADKLADKLSSAGNVAVGKVDVGEKTWWRVRLGPFKDKSEADDALGSVRVAGVADARITHQ